MSHPYTGRRKPNPYTPNTLLHFVLSLIPTLCKSPNPCSSLDLTPSCERTLTPHGLDGRSGVRRDLGPHRNSYGNGWTPTEVQTYFPESWKIDTTVHPKQMKIPVPFQHRLPVTPRPGTPSDPAFPTPRVTGQGILGLPRKSTGHVKVLLLLRPDRTYWGSTSNMKTLLRIVPRHPTERSTPRGVVTSSFSVLRSRTPRHQLPRYLSRV